jgi:pyrroline-5-carboxylate reductase
MAKNRIGVVGAGIMGEALISSLLDHGVSPSLISVIEKRKERADFICTKYSVATSSISNCQVVFLVVKPQDLVETLRELSGQINQDALVVSFVAGKTSSLIESHLTEGQRVIRAMPNTPIIVKKGFIALSRGNYASETDLITIKNLLSSSGTTISLEEKELDIVTALSGSGPAYFFLLTEAMAEAGERLGLSGAQSFLAAQQVLVGAANLLETTGKGPKVLREEVTSPNGTTQAALSKFEEQGFRELVYLAMKAAMDRSKELSN